MLAVGQMGLTPSEFLSMTPNHWWLFFESKLPPKKSKTGLDAETFDRLYAMLD
jgi:hypothetical protein